MTTKGVTAVVLCLLTFFEKTLRIQGQGNGKWNFKTALMQFPLLLSVCSIAFFEVSCVSLLY